jgi:hypothetical protein
MLEHLGSLGSLGQVIIFDNIDPPANATAYADIDIFTNNPQEGRQACSKQCWSPTIGRRRSDRDAVRVYARIVL